MSICLYPGCPAIVASGRCPEHARAHQQAYEATRKDLSFRKLSKSPRWIRYSRIWLGRFPLCGMRQDGERHPNQSICTREGLIVAATMTDHIIPTSRGGSIWNPKNHQSLCGRCNTAKGDTLPSGNDGAWATDDPQPVMA